MLTKWSWDLIHNIEDTHHLPISLISNCERDSTHSDKQYPRAA